ncbi:MAG: carboxypeptidase regulatory-like domain-containing protein [Candidatus Zhuqueibacterota bacterium]
MKTIRIFLYIMVLAQTLLASEKISAIHNPLMTQPVITLPGGTFVVHCTADASATDWEVIISTRYFSRTLPVTASYDNGSAVWALTVSIPANTPFELYHVRVRASGGIDDTSPNSLRIISEYKQSYYFIHVPDAHLPSCSWVGYYDDENTVPEFERIIGECNLINPEFILQTGDLVDNGQVETGFDIAGQSLLKSTIPFFITGGNHDLWYDGHANWHSYFGSSMNFSFNYGEHFFCGMEMYDIPSVTFTAAQMDWLQDNLAASRLRSDKLRVLFYHYDESHQIDDEFVDENEIDLILYGHTHINGVSYLGSRNALNINTSYTMNDNGAYRLIKIHGDEVTEYPLLRYKQLSVRYSPTNDGTNWIINALITNDSPIQFENGLVKFIVPEDAAGYSVTGGAVQQVVPIAENKLLYYVEVNIQANAVHSVTLQSQSPPANHPPRITSFTPQLEITVTGGVSLTLSLAATDPDGDALAYTWLRNDQQLDMANASNYIFQNEDTYEGVDSIRAVVYDGSYRDQVQWVITTDKFSGEPQIVSDIGNFFAFNAPATIRWIEPTPISARLEFGTAPGDYSKGAIPETNVSEVTFVPQDYAMALGRYFCRVTDGAYSSREFFIIVESPIAPQMLSPLGNVQSLSPVFTWEKVPGVPYYWIMVSDQEVIVGKNSETGELMVEGANPIWAVLSSENEIPYGIPDPSHNFTSSPPPLIAGANYWWVVLNAYGNAPEFTSPVIAGVSEFKLDIAPPTLAAPALLSPANNATLNGDIVTFEWASVPGAVNFHVYPFKIEQESDMETSVPMWESIIATSNTYFDFPAYQRFVNGNYRWKIGAVDANGLEVHSETRDFIYDAPHAIVSIHTLDDAGTPDKTSDDYLLPRTKVEFTSIDGIFTGVPLSTDFHGNRENVNIAPGTYIFTASKDLYETILDTVTCDVDQSYSLYFRLNPSPCSLTGRVVDDNTLPVQNANVEAVHSLHTEIVKQTTSAANGHFSLSLSGGPWQISSQKEGYRLSGAATISLTAGQCSTLPQNLVLIKNTNIATGTVVNSENQPVFGATVAVKKDEQELSTLTDANGTFAFSLESGAWRLTVSKEGFVSPAATAFSVSGGIRYDVKPNPILTPNAAILSGYVSDGTATIDSVLVKAIPTTGSVITTWSDNFGYFALNVPPGTYSFLPQKDGYYVQSEKQITLAAGETVSGFDLILNKINAVISGKTTLNGTTPLEGVKISVGQLQTHSSSSGTFSLELTQGNYTIAANKDGFFSSQEQAVSVLSDQRLDQINFVLTPNASVIKGRVTADAGPIYAARVTASRYNAVSVFTDENGYFTLNLEAGVWDLIVEKENFLDAGNDSILIGAGQTLTGLNFSMLKNETLLQGVITAGPDNAPLRGAVITIQETGGETETKNDGRFSVALEPGHYTITARKDGYSPMAQHTGDMQAGQSYQYDFNLTPADCRISGNIIDETGAGLPDALIFLPGQANIQCLSNSRGEFSLQVIAGDYTFEARKSGYIPTSGPVALNLGPGENRSDVNFALQSHFAGLMGIVTDSLTGSPLLNALVTATGPENSIGSTYSLISGAFSFTDQNQRVFLPEGVYSLTVSKPGYASKFIPAVQLQGRATVTQDISLVSFSNSISGKVTSEAADISGATINAIHSQSSAQFSVLSSDDGEFSINSLPAGEYYLNAFKNGYTSLPDTLIRAGAANVPLELLPNLGRIAGHVLDEQTSQPLAGVAFYAYDNSGHFGTTSSGSTGNFVLENLATLHPYSLSVSKYGYETIVLELISADSSPELHLSLQKISGALSGMVRKTDGAPLSGVRMKIVMADNTARSDTTSAQGNYTFDGLPVGSYFIYAEKVGFSSAPQYLTATISRWGEIPNLDFVMDEAIAATISIRGSLTITNNTTSKYAIDALTADGRTAVIAPAWSFSPTDALDSLSLTGVVDPVNSYIGPVTISAIDTYSNARGGLDISVVSAIGRNSPAVTLHCAENVQISVPANCIDYDVQIGMKLPHFSDSQRLSQQYEIAGDVYELTPGTIAFSKPLTLTFPLPGKGDSFSLGRWNRSDLSWEIVPQATRQGETITVATNQLGRFAVLSESRPLAIDNIRLQPNPFSPLVSPLTIAFDLTSMETAHPSVTISVYNMNGDLVRDILTNEAIAKGAGKIITWDGKTNSGDMALNGRYLLHFKAKDSSGNQEALKAVVLIK